MWLILLTVIAFGMIFIQPAAVRAGTGNFKEGKFNFCVSVRFNATQAQLTLIENAFRDASQVLADATDGRHRFGAINIVNNSGASEEADFWVPSSGGRAVGTYGHFGKKGQHVMLYGLMVPAAGPDIEAWVAADRAYMIAHEFGHHAYGLLDEYANRKGETGPNISCPPPPTGVCNQNLEYCLMDAASQRGGGACAHPARLHTMNEFCVASNHDKPNASGVGDGETAQTASGKGSCWEAISRLKKTWQIPDAPTLPVSAPPAVSPTPTFGTSCAKPKVAILIDRSGSMITDNRLGFAKLGAEQFISSFGNGSLAVVSFSSSPSVDFPLMEVNDAAARNSAKAAVNALVADGATNIGDGLLAALGQLNSQGDCASCEKTIMLLSDGEHNTGTPPESVVTLLNNAGVKLVTSVVGSNITLAGESSLQNITAQTNGEYYRVSTASDATGQSLPGYGSSGLIGLFMRLGSDMTGDALVKQELLMITSGQVKEIPILVETRAVNSTFAVMKADQSDSVTVSLRSPAGVTYSGTSSPNVEFTSNTNSRSFRVTAPEQGTWTMVVSGGSIMTGKLEVLSFAKHDGVRLDAFVDEQNVPATENIQVYATPTFEGERVVGASVMGVVGRPDGSKVTISLFDDGLDSQGDVEANDGIYSAVFNSYSTEGTYVIELTAQNSTGRAYAGELLNPDAPSNDKPLPAFLRAASTTVTVSGLTQSGDTVWFDDALPEGATPHGDGEDWHWVDANPGSYSGSQAHQSRNFAQVVPPSTTVHQHYFDGATTTLPVNVGDKLFTYVFLDINNMPREIMLQWHDGNNWEHRARWGQNNINFGVDGSNGRRYMGPLPKAGQWVRLEVPASAVGLEGHTVRGMAFTLDGGRATWDLAGKTTANAAPPPTTPPGDFVWFEDALPAGAVTAVVDDNWNWVSNLAFRGQLSHMTKFAPGDGKQFRSHSFTGAQTPMLVNPGDVLFTYVYLGDPDFAHEPRTPDQIMLQWYDGTSWEHRAFWGVNFIGSRIPNTGVQSTEGQRYMGGLPAALGVGIVWRCRRVMSDWKASQSVAWPSPPIATRLIRSSRGIDRVNPRSRLVSP